MFGLGIGELFLIFCIALLFFGPKFFMRSIDGVRDSFSGFSKGLKSEVDEQKALTDSKKD